MTPRPSPAPPYVGLRLYKERTRRGWSLYQAGDASGLAHTTVSLAEQGRDIRLSTLLALAGAYGVSLDALTAEPGCGRCLDWGPCGECGRGGANGKTISDDKETAMTTETPAMTAEQIEARLTEIAPPPDPDAHVTAEGLARYFAVRAQLGFARNVTPFVRDDQLVPSWQICLEFAAAHLLFTLQGEVPDLADMVAQQVAQSWDDGGMGEWLHEYLATLGVDSREVARLDEARLALENAGEATP